MMDTSYDMVKLCKDTERSISSDAVETYYIVGDEEFLPIKERSVLLLRAMDPYYKPMGT